MIEPYQDEMMEWECFDDEVAIYDPSDQQVDIFKEVLCPVCGQMMIGLDCKKRCTRKQEMQRIVKPHKALVSVISDDML